MKKTINLLAVLILLFGTVLTLSSCKKDVSNLPGTWKVTDATVNGNDKKNLNDVWTFNNDGTCDIQCDYDEYFGNSHGTFDIISFEGKYHTNDNKTLTITSDKLNVEGTNYDQIIYDLDIVLLNKTKMAVSGSVTLYLYRDAKTLQTEKTDITLTLTKR